MTEAQQIAAAPIREGGFPHSESTTMTDAIPPHIQRVIDERDQLAERLEKLDAFLASDFFLTLEAHDRDLLSIQRAVMLSYASVLGTRLAKSGH